MSSSQTLYTIQARYNNLRNEKIKILTDEQTCNRRKWI